jgi:hypothetical protein
MIIIITYIGKHLRFNRSFILFIKSKLPVCLMNIMMMMMMMMIRFLLINHSILNNKHKKERQKKNT